MRASVCFCMLFCVFNRRLFGLFCVLCSDDCGCSFSPVSTTSGESNKQRSKEIKRLNEVETVTDSRGLHRQTVTETDSGHDSVSSNCRSSSLSSSVGSTGSPLGLHRSADSPKKVSDHQSQLDFVRGTGRFVPPALLVTLSNSNVLTLFRDVPVPPSRTHRALNQSAAATHASTGSLPERLNVPAHTEEHEACFVRRSHNSIHRRPNPLLKLAGSSSVQVDCKYLFLLLNSQLL